MAYRSSSQGTITSPATTPLPSGTVDGDIIVGLFITDTTGPAIALPSGWNAFTNSSQTMTYDGMCISAGWKAASSESDPITPGSSPTGLAAAAVFSGIDTTYLTANAASLQSYYQNTSGAASPWSIAIPTLTLPAACDLVLLAGYDKNGSGISTSTPPSGFTLAQHVEAVAGSYQSGQISYKNNVAAGATGTITASAAQSGASAAVTGFLIALPLLSAPSGSLAGINTGLIF